MDDADRISEREAKMDEVNFKRPKKQVFDPHRPLPRGVKSIEYTPEPDVSIWSRVDECCGICELSTKDKACPGIRDILTTGDCPSIKVTKKGDVDVA